MSGRLASLSNARGILASLRRFERHSDHTDVLLARLRQGLVIVAILALVAINVFGFLAALLLILASLLLLASRPGDSARILLRFWPMLLLPALAMASTIWSDAPARTLRAGLELMLTAVAAIVMCRNTSARTLITVMFFGLFAICLCTLGAVPAALRTGLPMQAFFGSKNELGMMAQLLFSLTLALLFDRHRAGLLRMVALGAAGLAIALISLSQSATAGTCAVITAVVFPVLVGFGRLPLGLRFGLVATLSLAGGLALPFLSAITAEIEDVRGTVLKKDSTLTGRTYLWDVARQLSSEEPALGHGYAAFWREGNLDAEALWRWGGVPNKSGFNFHNAFIEMRVDLGWVGVGLLGLTCLGVMVLVIARQILRPSAAMAFIVTLELVFYIRSITESGLVAPFSFITVLWLGGAIFAAGERKETLSAIPRQDDGLPSSFRGRQHLPIRRPMPPPRRG